MSLTSRLCRGLGHRAGRLLLARLVSVISAPCQRPSLSHFLRTSVFPSGCPWSREVEATENSVLLVLWPSTAAFSYSWGADPQE